MNVCLQPCGSPNLFRLSDGAEHHPREEGRFQVRSTDQISDFPTLLQAFLFYLRLGQAATLWDISDGAVLIERKIPITFN